MAQQLIDAGEQISEDRHVFQLHMSLPSKFDSAMDFYKNLEEDGRTYETYRKKLLEKNNRLHKMENRNHPDDRTKPTSSKEEQTSLKITCFTCGEAGHKSTGCPQPEKNKKPITNESTSTKDLKKKLEWAQFKTHNKEVSKSTTAMSADIHEESLEYFRELCKKREIDSAHKTIHSGEEIPPIVLAM